MDINTNMHQNLLFFDIDGTLLSEYTHQIPESALTAIMQAQANGHLAFINTGRTYRSMPDMIRNLPFDGFLCGCGTRIIYHGETLMAHSIPFEAGNRIIDLLEAHHLEAFLEGSNDVYCKRGLYTYDLMNQIKATFLDLGLCKSGFIDDRNCDFDKFIIVTQDTNAAQAFFKEVSDLINAIDRGNGMYECLPIGYTKASGMAYIADHLNIPMTHTYAFGDSSNDLDMFKAAGHGIAMKEHADVLDPYAELIADAVENDGILKAMKKLGLI